MINNKENKTATELEWILARPNIFRYQLLGRMQMDCDYYLCYGRFNGNHLYMGNDNLEGQIEVMKAIWHSFSEKPVWITLEQIEDYRIKMLAVLNTDIETQIVYKVHSQNINSKALFTGTRDEAISYARKMNKFLRSNVCTITIWDKAEDYFLC